MKTNRRPWSVLAPTVLCAILMAVPVMLSFAPSPAEAPRASPAAAVAFTPDEIAYHRAWSAVANLTPAETQEKLVGLGLQGRYTAASFHQFAVEQAQWTFLGCSLSCYILTGVAGCAVGGIIGGIVGAGIGAGAGCLSGAAVAVLATYFAQGAANAASSGVELAVIRGLAASINNDHIFINGLVQSTTSALNSSFNAFAQMADAAALAQLPNATFDPLADMNASGVATQMATIVSSITNAVEAAWSSTNAAFLVNYGPNGPFSSGAAYNMPVTGSSGGYTFGGAATPYMKTVNGAAEGSAVDGSGVALLAGGGFYVACSTPSWANMDGGTLQVVVPSATTVFVGSTGQATNGATFRFHVTTAGSCDLIGRNFIMVPASGSTNPTTQVVIVECDNTATTSCVDYNQSSSAHAGKLAYSMTVTANAVVGGALQAGPYTLAGTVSSFKNELNSLMLGAETEAKTYWTYLHLLGYTNVNQIPSNCIIPFPNQILPPQYSTGIGTLTLNQSLALYQAWLNGLATFFNTAQNTTTFCKGHTVFNLGFAVSWNLNVITTGFVFTLPKANQNFGQLSTWTVTNATQTNLGVVNVTHKGLRTSPAPIVLWSNVKTLWAKVGRLQEVPVDNPLTTFSPNNGTLYQLFGNGSAESASGFSNGTQSSSTGAALWISTCAILQGAGVYALVANGSYCPLQLSSIANVSFGGTGVALPVFPTSASACGQTFPLWAQLVQAWDSITFNLPLGFGCIAAEILAFISLVVIIIIVAYIVRLSVNVARSRGEE